MQFVFEISLVLLVVSLSLTVAVIRFRRLDSPEKLIAAMHKQNLPDLELVTSEIFLNPDMTFAELLRIRHNAICLVNLCRLVNKDEDLSYLTHRVVMILFCILWAIIAKGVQKVVRGFPQFAGKWACSIYAEMWLRAKAIIYEYRSDLIPALEKLT